MTATQKEASLCQQIYKLNMQFLKLKSVRRTKVCIWKKQYKCTLYLQGFFFKSAPCRVSCVKYLL